MSIVEVYLVPSQTSTIELSCENDYFLNMLSWANSLIVKSATRSNMLEINCKTKDQKYAFTNMLVFFLRPSSKKYSKCFIFRK